MPYSLELVESFIKDQLSEETFSFIWRSVCAVLLLPESRPSHKFLICLGVFRILILSLNRIYITFTGSFVGLP